MHKYIKFALLLLLAIIILVWFGRGLDWEEVGRAVRQADARLIALAILLVCTTYLIRAFRWRALLAPLASVNLRDLFAATTVGFGALFLLGRAGEIARPVFLASQRKRQVSTSAAFITIAVERIYDMAAIIVLFAATLALPGSDALVAGGDGVDFARVRWVGFVLLALAVVGICALVLFRWRAQGVLGWLETRFARARVSIVRRAGQIVINLLRELASALGVLTNVRDLTVTVGWTCLLWAVITSAYVLVLRAFGLEFGVREAIFVMGWSLIGSLVPTPGGGAGAFHATTGVGLVLLGVARDRAAAIAIVSHLALFAPATLFGIYYFLRSDVQFSQLRRERVPPRSDDALIEARAEEANASL